MSQNFQKPMETFTAGANHLFDSMINTYATTADFLNQTHKQVDAWIATLISQGKVSREEGQKIMDESIRWMRHARDAQWEFQKILREGLTATFAGIVNFRPIDSNKWEELNKQLDELIKKIN